MLTKVSKIMNLAEVELVGTLEAENLNLEYYIHTKHYFDSPKA